MKQITIVGAGFSGSLTAVHLLRGAPIPLHIRLIEQAANQVAKGLAYNTTQTCHLLNVPAGSMSAFPDEPDHFLNWARANCRAETPWVPEISPTAFLPRAWYGLYLAQVLRDAITAAQGRHAIEILTDEVTSVTPSGEGYDVRTRLGAWWHTELCVLALGNFAQMRPADPPVCHRNPWAPDVLETLLKTRQCLLVGSGLTTLDLVVALRTNRYAGKIHIVSRRGLTPQRHRAYGQTAVLDHDALKGGNLRALVREVRQRIATQMDKGGDWRSVIDAMRPHSARLWLSLSLSDRRTFMRHVRPYWDNHRHRTAAPIDDIFRAAMTDGSILLHRARVTGYEVSATGGVTATLRGCGLPPRQLEVDRIVYCTGPEPDLQKLDVPLLRQLFAEGRVQTNPVGFGLATNASGALIDATGQASPALFTIGPHERAAVGDHRGARAPHAGDGVGRHLAEATGTPPRPSLARALTEPAKNAPLQSCQTCFRCAMICRLRLSNVRVTREKPHRFNQSRISSYRYKSLMAGLIASKYPCTNSAG